jgi:hypothetical protein
VLASLLIRNASTREWTRLEAWATAHVPAPLARSAVARAFGDTYFRAASWWRTADGPHAMLLGSTDASFRMSTFGRHYFIPKNVRLTCTLPDLGELLELAQAYAWLGAAARYLDLDYDLDTMVFAAIEAHGVFDPIERAVKTRRFEAAKGREMLARLLDAADVLADPGTALAAQTEAVARREYERSRRWLLRTAAQRGCHVSG